MKKSNKAEDLEKRYKEQQEEIDKLKKKMKRQKWMNIFFLWSK